MVRTVDPVAYSVRRDAYVDAALRLIQKNGYEELTVQDLIEEVGASRGAFFHYFDTKAALLAAVVDRMVEVATRQVTPIAADPRLTALDKLQGVFDGIAQWKSAQPEFQPEAVTELMRVWYSDENTIVLARRDGVVSFDTVMGTLAAYAEAFERILGIPPSSWPLVDEATLRFWFG